MAYQSATIDDVRRSIATIFYGRVVRCREEETTRIQCRRVSDESTLAPSGGESKTNQTFMDSFLSPHYYPLQKGPSFRPSEIMQGIYLGALKDVTGSNREKLISEHNIRVFVCCCAVPQPSTAVSPKILSKIELSTVSDEEISPSSHADTANTIYRPCLAEIRIDLKDRPNGEVRKIERFQGEWWRNDTASQNELEDWVRSKFLEPPEKVTQKELILRIPAVDEVTYSFAKPSAPYLFVVPAILDQLISASESSVSGGCTSKTHDVKSLRIVEAQRRFGIAVYCVAGKSRSVTMLAATLLFRFSRCISETRRSASNETPNGTFHTQADLRVLTDSIRNSVESTAQLLVDVVLEYLRSRRLVACPNPGFYRQLVGYAVELFTCIS